MSQFTYTPPADLQPGVEYRVGRVPIRDSYGALHVSMKVDRRIRFPDGTETSYEFEYSFYPTSSYLIEVFWWFMKQHLHSH